MDGLANRLQRRTLYAFVFVPIICLTVLGILLYVYLATTGAKYQGAMKWINIAAEASGVMWWSSLLWGFAALLCLLEFDRKRTRLRYYWLALAIGSLLLSLDESVQIHEQFGWVAKRVFGKGYWHLAAIPIATLCFLALIPFLKALPRKTAKAMIRSGAIYVLAAVGLEMVFDYFRVTRPGSTKLFWTLMTLEECLEMVGIGLFCVTVHEHLNRPCARDETSSG